MSIGRPLQLRYLTGSADRYYLPNSPCQIRQGVEKQEWPWAGIHGYMEVVRSTGP